MVDATSIVSNYINLQASHLLMQQNQPAGTPITQEAAIQVAASALTATGQAESLGSANATQQQITSPATAAGNLWVVSFQRQFQGIPYHTQQATILLLAESGTVEAISLTFPTPGPTAPATTITSDQASAAAVSQLQAVGVASATLLRTMEQVVQPNTFWQSGGSATPQPGKPPRVVWACDFQDGSGIDEVWIDAETGFCLGGETWQKAGIRRTHNRGGMPLPNSVLPVRKNRRPIERTKLHVRAKSSAGSSRPIRLQQEVDHYFARIRLLSLLVVGL